MLKITEICKKIKHKFDNKRLYMDLELQVARIRDRNREKMIQKLLTYVRDLEERQSGLLLTDKEAYRRAYAIFIVGKMTGKLDQLNADTSGAV